MTAYILFWWNSRLRKAFLFYHSPWEKNTRKWRKLGIVGEYTGLMPGVRIRDKKTVSANSAPLLKMLSSVRECIQSII